MCESVTTSLVTDTLPGTIPTDVELKSAPAPADVPADMHADVPAPAHASVTHVTIVSTNSTLPPSPSVLGYFIRELGKWICCPKYRSLLILMPVLLGLIVYSSADGVVASRKFILWGLFMTMLEAGVLILSMAYYKVEDNSLRSLFGFYKNVLEMTWIVLFLAGIVIFFQVVHQADPKMKSVHGFYISLVFRMYLFVRRTPYWFCPAMCGVGYDENLSNV